MSLYRYRVKIRSNYDGDSFRANIFLGFGNVEEGLDGRGAEFRLYGCDTPEVRGSHREAGKLVKVFVQNLIPANSIKIIESIRDTAGVYGRYLAKVELGDGRNLTDILLENKFAKPTGKGGKRPQWSEDELQYIINTLENAS